MYVIYTTSEIMVTFNSIIAIAKNVSSCSGEERLWTCSYIQVSVVDIGKLGKTSFCHEMINFSARQGVILAVFEIGSRFWAQKNWCPKFDELEKKNKASIYRKCQYI